MNDVVVAFARLWGQKEVLAAPWDDYDERVTEELKSWDSQECLELLSKWAEEYLLPGQPIDDTVEFFDMKVRELVPPEETDEEQ